MREIALFVEDFAHQQVIGALVRRLANAGWLLDGAAFRDVFGKGCDAPDRKCDRDRYKQRLVEAIRATAITPKSGRDRVRRRHHASDGHRARHTGRPLPRTFRRRSAIRVPAVAVVTGFRAVGRGGIAKSGTRVSGFMTP